MKLEAIVSYIKKLRVNRIVKYFVIVDLVFLSGWGLIGPIFPIFILEEIEGATLFTVGAAIALYWFVRSVIQLPVAILLDEHEGEKDDFFTLILGLMLAGFAAMSFLVVRTIFGLFVVEFFHAVAFGLYAPSWSAIFSRHLDKKQFAFDWSLDHTAIGVSYAIASFLGGVMAKLFGFQSIFIITSIISFASAFLLFFVPHLVLPKIKSRQALVFDHTPKVINK